MCAYGAAGAGLRRACISSVAAIVAFLPRIKTASLNCAGENQLCLAVSLIVFMVRIYYNSGNGPWLDLCTIHIYLVVPNFV